MKHSQIEDLIQRFRAHADDCERNFTFHQWDEHRYRQLADELSALLREEAWQPIETYQGNDYALLNSPAHGRVVGAHVTGDVWHLVGVGAITGESERPTHWMPLPAAPKGADRIQEEKRT